VKLGRGARWALGLIAAQVALAAVYWAVERSRARDGATRSPLTSTAPPRVLDGAAAGPVPPIALRRRDGTTAPLMFEAAGGGASGRPTLLHVWATWCPPCRAELPGLLALPRRHDVNVIAVALDDRWSEVDRFSSRAGLDATRVVLADGAEVRRALDVTSLPVTFFVDADGHLRLRFDGPRDWENPTFVRVVLED
jgi:thiol-disulfide isomerase/thioredoxin